MASQKNLTKLQHKPTGEVYYTRKNQKKLAETKLKMKKYSRVLRKHVLFEEVKKISKKKGIKTDDTKAKSDEKNQVKAEKKKEEKKTEEKSVE